MSNYSFSDLSVLKLNLFSGYTSVSFTKCISPPVISLCGDEQQHTQVKISSQIHFVEDTNWAAVPVRPVSNSLWSILSFTKPTPIFMFYFHISQTPGVLCVCRQQPSSGAMLSSLRLVTFQLSLPCDLLLEMIIMGEIFTDSCWTVLYARASNPIFFFIYFVNITP